MPEKLVTLSFATLVIISVFLLARSAGTISLNLPQPSQLLDFITNLVPMDAAWATPSPSPQASPSPSTTPIPTPIPSKSPCFRFTIPNSSTKCYTQSNHNQLVNLGYQYQSSQTFYQFHLDGAARYQQEYEKTGSSIYLDAKASQESKANEQKRQMDAIIQKMQDIEPRGWNP